MARNPFPRRTALRLGLAWLVADTFDRHTHARDTIAISTDAAGMAREDPRLYEQLTRLPPLPGLRYAWELEASLWEHLATGISRLYTQRLDRQTFSTEARAFSPLVVGLQELYPAALLLLRHDEDPAAQAILVHVSDATAAYRASGVAPVTLGPSPWRASFS